MTGGLFVFVIGSAVIFSFLFWLLTFLAKIFYTNKHYSYKLNFYECGFKAMSKTKIQYELNYIMLILFLIIYDGEFLILIPLAFNSSIISLSIVLSFGFFILWLLIALFVDYAFNALDWQN